MGLASKLQAAAMAGGAGYGATTGISAGQNFNRPSSGLPQTSYAPTPSQYSQGQQPPASGYGTGQSSYGQNQSSYGQGQPQYGQQSGYGQAPTGQYGQAPSGQYGQPPQSQYGQAPSQYGQQQPPSQYGHGQYGQPQGQYGQAPSQYGAPQGQYGQPQGQYGQQSGPQQGGSPLFSLLESCVRDQGIGAFYSPSSLQQLAAQPDLMPKLQGLAHEWQMPTELAMDLIKIALFDTILLIDDSGSMSFEENGERIEDMKSIVSKVAHASSLFDRDGIQVRFLNTAINGDNIRDEQDVLRVMSQVQFKGLTPLGTSMQQRILEPLVLGPARQQRLRKPVLIIAVTDGAPQGEDKWKIRSVIEEAKRELSRTQYGPDSVSFQFVQVGTDMKARSFLAELDADPSIGRYIDCTSNYEMEADEMSRIGVQNFSPSVYLMKLLLGSIDSSYDTKDETRR